MNTQTTHSEPSPDWATPPVCRRCLYELLYVDVGLNNGLAGLCAEGETVRAFCAGHRAEIEVDYTGMPVSRDRDRGDVAAA